jgi:hypothetical protein
MFSCKLLSTAAILVIHMMQRFSYLLYREAYNVTKGKSILFALSKILLGHSNSGVLRVTIIRKVVVYRHSPAERVERLLRFPLSPFLLCGWAHVRVCTICPYSNIYWFVYIFYQFFSGFCLRFVHEYFRLRKTTNNIWAPGRRCLQNTDTAKYNRNTDKINSLYLSKIRIGLL